MTVYVTGDVHGRAEYGASRFAFKSWPLGRTLMRDDVVIVAGDFGFVWDGSNAERYWLDWFESKPWTTCFVDGNHENHHALAELPVREWSGGLVHEVRPHVLHLMRGGVFDIAGTTVLAMGGAASNDRQCRASLNRVGWRVDYVVTHEAPAALARELCRERGREYRGDQLQTFLGELDGRLDYRAWFFGHYHGDEWRDDRHRLVYRDIVPIESAAPGSQF